MESIILSKNSLTKAQQEDFQKLQQLSQQLSQLRNQALQYDSQKHELNRTVEVLKKLPDDREIFRGIGQIFYKDSITSTRSELTEKIEMLDVRVNQIKKQIEAYEKMIKDIENKLKSSL